MKNTTLKISTVSDIANLYLQESLMIIKLKSYTFLKSKIQVKQFVIEEIKRTVVFDLDETLIHCNDSNEDPCDFQVDIDFPDNETI